MIASQTIINICIEPLEVINNLNEIRYLIVQIVTQSYVRISQITGDIATIKLFDNESGVQLFGSADLFEQISSLIKAFANGINGLSTLYSFHVGSPQIDNAQKILFQPTAQYLLFDDTVSNPGNNSPMSFLDFMNEFQAWSYTVLAMNPNNTLDNSIYYSKREFNNMYLNFKNIDDSTNNILNLIVDYTQTYIDLITTIFLIVLIVWVCLIPIIYLFEYFFMKKFIDQDKVLVYQALISVPKSTIFKSH